MLDGRLRVGVERGTAPVGAALRRTGVTPDQLTGLGLLLAGAAAAAVAGGHLILGAVLIGLCGLADLLDGPVAKAAGSASLRGAFFDSVADRLSDIFLLAGVGWYLATSHSAHLAVLALGVLAASMLPSYVRAKADTLGLAARGGLMERAERMIVLGVAIFVQAFVSEPVLVPALWLILALSLLTALQRFVSGWRQASTIATAVGPGPAGAGPPDPIPAEQGLTGAANQSTTARAGPARSERAAGSRRPRRDGAARPHLRGGPSSRPGDLGVRWGAPRFQRMGLEPRSGSPARPESRRQGWGGEDPTI